MVDIIYNVYTILSWNCGLLSEAFVLILVDQIGVLGVGGLTLF